MPPAVTTNDRVFVPRVVVMAKEPEPGEVKTRLCPPLSPVEAAEWHAAFVEDTLSRLQAGLPEGLERRLAVCAVGAFPRLGGLAERLGWPVVEQGPGDLGARMQRQLRAGCAHGAACVVVGADAPDLPVGFVTRAVEALTSGRAQAVIGPAMDGGYYLIGFRGAVPDVFTGQSWGQGSVFARTRARLAGLGLRFEVLPHWYDVDDWVGLRALERRLRSLPPGVDEASAPRATCRLLAGLQRRW